MTTSGQGEPEPMFFETPAAFRAWLETHYASAKELWVGYFKKSSGRPSITWPESVDEALCFGWIDGLRKTIDAERYRIRFTPRKAGSIWSAVNVERIAELTAAGRMHNAGLRAFAGRKEERTAIYSYEQRGTASLSDEDQDRLRADPAAWAFFQAQPAAYRRGAIWWVMSAKQPATRQRRLDTLIADSAASRTIKRLTPPGKQQAAPAEGAPPEPGEPA